MSRTTQLSLNCRPDVRPAVLAACGANHSTETMVLKVLADILWTLNCWDLTALTLLDNSFASDTVVYETLLQYLNQILRSVSADVCSNSLNSLTSDSINWFWRSSSTLTKLVCGVPRGSNLGQLRFLWFVNAAWTTISTLTPHIYTAFVSVLSSKPMFRTALCDVGRWMRSNWQDWDDLMRDILDLPLPVYILV